MASKTTHSCDRCNKTTELNELWSVGVSVTTKVYGDQYATDKIKADWCRNCCDALNLIVPKPKKSEPATAQPSLEDVVREIVRQEISMLPQS